MSDDIRFEFVPGGDEQVEVFNELQRLLVRLYNDWEGDTAIAVFASALGNVCAMIETQYNIHLDMCPKCQERYGKAGLDIASVARSNFDYYYDTGMQRTEDEKAEAIAIVERFFSGRKH